MNYFRRGRLNSAKDREGKIGKIRSWGALDLLMYLGGVMLLRNFPFVGEVRLTVLTGSNSAVEMTMNTVEAKSDIAMVNCSAPIS